MEDENSTGSSVQASVELTGNYDQIAEILGENETSYEELAGISEDMASVLDIVTRTGGATKGRIAENLPPHASSGLDADGVIHVLRVLELYELVALDGNTWRPGPALSGT